jgi:hypothetical protein
MPPHLPLQYPAKVAQLGWKVAIVPAFRKWLCRAIIHAQRRIEELG